jgi:lysophospholipase L1-like esterase
VIFPKQKKSGKFSRYVALGDSISTDDYPGEARGAASLFYQNLDSLYPEFAGKDLRHLYPGIAFSNLAVDGASSSDVLHRQLTKAPAKEAGRTVVTLTAGGNDILSAGDPAAEIIFRLQTILSELQARYPDCVILLGTVYDPTDGVGDLFESRAKLERELKILDELNSWIRSNEKPGSILILEIYRHFLGHGSHCKDPQNPFYQKNDPSLWYVLNIEPNARGAYEIRRLMWAALGETQSITNTE